MSEVVFEWLYSCQSIAAAVVTLSCCLSQQAGRLAKSVEGVRQLQHKDRLLSGEGCDDVAAGRDAATSVNLAALSYSDTDRKCRIYVHRQP